MGKGQRAHFAEKDILHSHSQEYYQQFKNNNSSVNPLILTQNTTTATTLTNNNNNNNDIINNNNNNNDKYLMNDNDINVPNHKLTLLNGGFSISTAPVKPHSTSHLLNSNSSGRVFVSRKEAKSHLGEEQVEEATPLFVLFTTYLSYLIIIAWGQIRDWGVWLLDSKSFAHLQVTNGYAAITSGFDNFFHRRMYVRIRDVFNRPITNVPGRVMTLLERESTDYNLTFRLTGNTRKVLNLSSYNYLGFAQSVGPCADAVEESIRRYGISSCSSRQEVGSLELHKNVETLVARFFGTEDAMVVSMGFATNSTTLPALVSKGCLVISDELNHASLVYGVRVSGASIKVFKHNDMTSLESVLRSAISEGQPRSHRPWKKILVVVEGLYSMEGNIVDLPGLMALKDKYRFYLYLDEAHSIGALGTRGRGVCDYFGIDPKRVDVLMGTFTKSFGAAGGYISGTKEIIDAIRVASHSAVYAEGVSVPVLSQVEASMRMIMGEIGGDEGKEKMATLARNSRYFAAELRRMGFIVYGSDSPVVPLLLCNPAKIGAFSREMLERGIAVVVVGYPATPLITSRVRFCISASHTLDDIKFALNVISEVGDRLMLKVSSKKRLTHDA